MINRERIKKGIDEGKRIRVVRMRPVEPPETPEYARRLEALKEYLETGNLPTEELAAGRILSWTRALARAQIYDEPDPDECVQASKQDRMLASTS